MKRVWQTSAAVLGGLLVAAISAMPQAYTVSAKPGAVNYIEGHAFLNGQPLSDKGLRSTFLNANDTLSTDLGKAEILLTPGVFLRIGDNSEIRMVSPSLTDTQVELKKGKAMIERDFAPSFSLRLAAKDAGLVEESAGRRGMDLPLATTVRRQLERAVEEHGDDDMSAAFVTVAPRTPVSTGGR